MYALLEGSTRPLSLVLGASTSCPALGDAALMLRRTAVLILVFCTAVPALEVCGNYCGPTWCSGQKLSECNVISGDACDRSASDCDEASSTDGSCADDCCRTHDACCGSSDRRGCNHAIIACLKECTQQPGPHCYRGDLPVPVDAILVGMELDPYGCCGTSCASTAPAGAQANQTVRRQNQSEILR